MYILVSENFIKGLIESGQSGGTLTGEYLPGDEVVRFWDESSTNSRELGRWQLGMEPEWTGATEGQLLACISGLNVAFYRRENGEWQPQPHETMNLYTD